MQLLYLILAFVLPIKPHCSDASGLSGHALCEVLAELHRRANAVNQANLGLANARDN